MRPRITVITLGVDDLERAVRFYREGLGLATEGIIGTEFEHGAVAFFDLDGGMRLALWPRASIAHDTGLPETPSSPTDVTLAQNVGSRDEVDRVFGEARDAGATVVKAPADTFYGGYAAYVQDPDGHVWEIAYNPGFTLDRDGAITVPDFGAS